MVRNGLTNTLLCYPPPHKRLEISWLGKDQRPRLEPRILLEDPTRSYHAAHRTGPTDHFDNRLIFGDNLLALKALEAEFTGQVKCVFIDPPYNTGNAFTHYDDGLEHSLWLTLMRDRLELLRTLLRPDGSIWITLDDNEHAYCKVLCDEVFGRQNFVGNVVWQHSVQGKNDAKTFSLHNNHVLVYQKTEAYFMKKLPREEKHNVAYSNPDNDKNGAWRSGDVRSPNYRENLRYDIETPSGKKISPPDKGWRWSKETAEEKIATGEIIFAADETRIVRKIWLEKQEGRVPESIWFGEEVGTTREANKEVTTFNAADPFATPKPERLLHRILTLATNPGDLVLDSFAGSGTTGAVAHKMGRRWIMVELGEHCHTHVMPRLRKVIDGQDVGGVTAATGWAGGGGYRYFRLAPSLLTQDRWGRLVVNQQYNPAMLAEAVCKLEGFRYAPSTERFWEHGHSSGQDFLYVTTQMLTEEQLRHLAEEVGPEQTLLVCCAAWRGAAPEFPNLTLKKLPQAVMHRCEWSHDDDSLNVASLTEKPATPRPATPAASVTAGLPLFDAPGGAAG